MTVKEGSGAMAQKRVWSLEIEGEEGADEVEEWYDTEEQAVEAALDYVGGGAPVGAVRVFEVRLVFEDGKKVAT